jgi:NAD(P)H-dependent FMN reductase
MKPIFAFCGSNSSNSINKQLLDFTISQISDREVSTLDLTEYNLPIYSIDVEKASGIPEAANDIYAIINAFDALIIAVNEHNWNVSTFFKNIIDWLSRINSKFLEDKKLFILSTSPGRGGADRASQYVVERFPKFGAVISSRFSLKSFNHSFSVEKGIYDEAQNLIFKAALQTYLNAIS